MNLENFKIGSFMNAASELEILKACHEVETKIKKSKDQRGEEDKVFKWK